MKLVQIKIHIFTIRDKRCTTYAAQHYSVGQRLTHQRNAIRMAFRWWADGGLLLDVYWETSGTPQNVYCLGLVIF